MKLVPFKILTLLLSTLLLQSCYYLSLYEGQMKIQLGEKRIESVLQDSEDLHPVAKHRLKLILSVRKFAAETLGLKTGKNYLYYYDTLGRAPSYVVIAAYPTKLAYYYRVFPFVGKLPYKGYFYLHAAQAEYERLQLYWAFGGFIGGFTGMGILFWWYYRRKEEKVEEVI